MAITWFPGHMLTAQRDAAATMAKVDVVIEVLDARVPRASRNPTFVKLRKDRQRPALEILNKADLADPRRTKLWLDHFNAQPGTKAVAISTKNPGEVGRVLEHCRTLAPHRGTIAKPLRMMILGMPNVGKSTLMNALLKKKVAKVGDEPAITKQQMRHELSQTMSLVDTPGMTWPRMDQVDAVKLAASNLIGRNAYDELSVALELGEYLLAEYAPLLAARYGPPPDGIRGDGLLALVAERRGLRLKGGDLDLEKAAGVLLGDFRSGAIGRITLETPEEVARRGETAADE